MRYYFKIIVVIFLLLFHATFLFAGYNAVKFLGHLYAPHGTSGQNTQFSNCWGWVSPDGKEYALIGTYTGTSIIDLNSDTLKEVAFIEGPTAAYCYREIKTYKHYAYIVSEGGAGIQIVDLSGLPDTAVLVKNFIYTDSLGRNVLRSHTITEADGYLYCNGSVHWPPGGVVIFSLQNDATNPELVGTYEPQYIHDSYVRNDTLFAAAIYSGGGLYVVDVHDKQNPQQLAYISYTGSGTHHVWASVDGKYAFTTDEIGSSGYDVKVWNISALPSFSQVASFSANPSDRAHNVHGRGNYLYVSHYKSGMRAVDVHDPTNPVELGFYDTYTANPDTVPGPFGGCWGVYPYFPSGKIIASDMQTGLYVFTFDDLQPRKRVRLLSPADGDSVYPLVDTLRWTSSANQVEDPHLYDVHIKFPNGNDTVITKTDTTMTVFAEVNLQSLGEYTWYVVVRDEYTEVSSIDTFRFTVPEITGIDQSEKPFEMSLHQNYPNPFNPLTKISFTLRATTSVTLKVFNILGEEVGTLLQGERLGAGNHEVAFRASNLSSGIYYYRLTTPEFSETRQMVLSK
jgi:choice-of-anchor B domain-containing protein